MRREGEGKRRGEREIGRGSKGRGREEKGGKGNGKWK